jgi:DNA (cytosine-5)-methyltransferase 1
VDFGDVDGCQAARIVIAVDLFAGPGGWDQGARALGIDPLGIELDPQTVETRLAAGLHTVIGDVTVFPLREADAVDLLIASPPCQAWSAAGLREAEHDRLAVYELAQRWGEGDDTVAWNDRGSRLAAEPMRWIRALVPNYVVLEQVPPVLELWEICAELLRPLGYSVWTGILEAERYGVPQTRERAFLVADLGGIATPPRPTHQRYVYGEPRLSAPELTLDGEICPWISMADALGWPETDRIGFERIADDRGAANAEGYRERDLRPASAPAFSLTEKARSWIHDRPSTTIAGDIRAFSPGGHRANDGRNNEAMVGRSENAIRLSPSEAGILQGFPADYPWRGSQTSKFQQIGNAVPPPLAEAVLRALVPSWDRNSGAGASISSPC